MRNLVRYKSKTIMKVLLLLATIILVVSALTDRELWLQFKQTHGKTYKSLKEEQLRYRIFQENLHIIEIHNARYQKGQETYYMGVNQFSDYTDEEFVKMLTYNNKASRPRIDAELFVPSNKAENIPDSIDWRDKGAVLGVKMQRCADCWAFSTAGALEGQNAIKNGKRISLSVQNLIDCSTEYSNEGCYGGMKNDAYAYVKDYGIESETDYPYEAKNGVCRFNASKSALTLNGFAVVQSKNETALKEAVATIGPISVDIDGRFIRSYAGGVFQDNRCMQVALNHAVLAVGYGNENGYDYWLVKNSYGPLFGEEGYIKMLRNANNRCGIASNAVYPILA